MTTLDTMAELLATEVGLATVATIRADGRPLLSVVNAGITEHPVTGAPAVAFVSAGSAARLGHLRARPHLTVLARRTWQWAAAEGDAELIGPVDRYDGFDDRELPRLLRTIYTAAGGQHEDWDEFDRVMSDEKRCAVVLVPDRVYSNRS